MTSLILNTIPEDEISIALKLLDKKGILIKNKKCCFCKKEINLDDVDKIGGFIPKKINEKTKVTIFCDDSKCKLDAYSAIKKFNGNGSPIFSEEE